ncbi:MAG: hypothetical protein RIQ61_520 [Bacteroidota bacterium]|jgi:hypothetical protein
MLTLIRMQSFKHIKIDEIEFVDKLDTCKRIWLHNN